MSTHTPASVIFEHEFDPELLEQIQTLRMTRLILAENMLRNVDDTAGELSERGYFDLFGCAFDRESIQKELKDRIAVLQQRMETPEVVHADEISLYVDLLENETEDLVDSDDV